MYSKYKKVLIILINFPDPCEPPPAVGAAVSGGAATAAPAANNPTNPVNTNNNTNNPVTPSTSTSPPGASSAASSSASTATSTAQAAGGGGGHHSPYDLRRKSPLSAETYGGGPSTSQQYAGDGNAYMLPARKRPRRSFSTSTDTCNTTAAHYLQYEMPDEVLLTIFSYLFEQDLCRVSLVCKRFNSIANDTELWKRLYQSVYEYDLPLFNPESCKFTFTKPEDSEFANPWKESFRQLYRGCHVGANYQDRKYKGRNILYFNTIKDALQHIDANTVAAPSTTSPATTYGVGLPSPSLPSIPYSPAAAAAAATSAVIPGEDGNSGSEQLGALIFVHAGHYLESLEIDKDVSLIGAAGGNVAESVILEKDSESTIAFGEVTKAYIGHMTLKFSPDVTSTVLHHKHFCLEIGENCCPTIDHCIIRSTSNGNFFYLIF